MFCPNHGEVAENHRGVSVVKGCKFKFAFETRKRMSQASINRHFKNHDKKNYRQILPVA